MNVILFLVGQQKSYAVVEPNGGSRVHVLPYPNAIYRIVVRGNQTANQFTIVEGIVYMNEGAGNHYHMREDETFFIINGTLQFDVDGDQFCARAGTTVYIPRNATQSVRNLNSKPVHIQILFAPSGIENYLEKVTPVFDVQPINNTAANEIALSYGVVNLNSVEWKDLNCVMTDASTHLKLSTYLTFLIIQFYIIRFLYKK
jgi:mannose-6-phosphate isomerase-like protein (cupin superfamily)